MPFARRALTAVVALVAGLLLVVGLSQPAGAQVSVPEVPAVTVPQVPTPGAGDGTETTASDPATISIDPGDVTGNPSNSVLIVLGLTILSVAPSLLIMMTSFTRMVIVMSLTRNAVGLQSIPPNQVVIGLSLFLSLFVMAPTLKEMNDVGLQPLLRGEITQSVAIERASQPLKEFMLDNTRKGELNMMIAASGEERPDTTEDVSLTTLIPSFILSELKTAFIIGFVIFVPFLIIDLVVSAVLMSLGMMMLPPVFVSLPFKLLLFVMVDGWSLIAESLVKSFN